MDGFFTNSLHVRLVAQLTHAQVIEINNPRVITSFIDKKPRLQCKKCNSCCCFNGTIKNYEVIAAIIILTREILISGLREFLAKGQIKLPVSNLAKLKTFLQMFSIALLLTGETGNKLINFQDYNAQTIGIILLWLSAVLTLFTGYEYIRKGIDHAISEDNKD